MTGALSRAFVVALAAVACMPAAAGAANPKGQRAKAQRLVSKLLAPSLPTARAVRCARARRGLRCRYRGRREISPNRTRRCRGRFTVRRRKGRLRARRRGRELCRLEVAARHPRLGFNDNSVGYRQATIEESANLNEALGVGIYRKSVDWRWVEPTRDSYDWRRYDRIYAALLERGIRPLWVVGYAPRWAWDFLTLCTGRACFYPPARSELGEWREFVRQVAARYPRAAAIEVWNEPNEKQFWNNGPDVGRYTELLREAAAAVRAAGTGVPVLAGALSDRARTSDAGVGLEEFLTGIYTSGGAGHLDGISVHLYPRRQGLPYIPRMLDEVRAIRNTLGSETTPLWVTEFGLSSTGSDYTSEAVQAAELVHYERALAAEPDVAARVVHTLVEPPGSSLLEGPGFGILEADFTPKPAFCALAAALRVPSDCPG